MSEHEKTAKRIADAIRNRDDGMVIVDRQFEQLEHDIEDALAAAVAAERAKFAAFADEKGEPRKVLGTLPLTADGAIVAANSVIWHPRYGASTCNFEVDSGCWAKTCDPYSPHAGELYEVNKCYSTKEAALAAAKEQKP